MQQCYCAVAFSCKRDLDATNYPAIENEKYKMWVLFSQFFTSPGYDGIAGIKYFIIAFSSPFITRQVSL